MTAISAVVLGRCEGIVKLTDCKLFSAFLYEAKPLKLLRAAFNNLSGFRSNPVNLTKPDEALHPIGSLDDLGLEIGQDAGQGAVKDRALIGAVGEQFPEKGKQTEQGRQPRETAVAILNVGGGDDAVQQQALRIDQNRPLLALDQLAGIEAVAVDASPPFSALFTL